MVFKRGRLDVLYEDPDSPPESDFSATPLSNWFTPIKSTKACSCCATQRKYGSFPKIPDSIFGFIDPDGNSRSLICNRCLQEVVDHFTAEDPEHNQYKSLYRICALTNLYYSDEIAHRVIEEERMYEDGSPVAPWLTWTILYFRAIMDHPIYSKRKFYESDNFLFNQVIDAQGKLSEIDKLPEQTKKNRASIITTYHRDPFENDPLEDRIQMYEDLLTMTTADVGENLPKSRAIIEIVKAYNRIDKINKTLARLQISTESMLENEKSIKVLVDNKEKELKAISQLCKDQGLSDKYATSGNKGLGTIGSVVREMADKNYDPGHVNRFDIETAAAMKQVADISMQSIFSQLNFSSADFAAIVREQGQIIREMQEVMDAQSEELRTLKCQYIKQELLDEYKNILKERGINPAEIDEIIEQQMKFVPFDTTGYYAPAQESSEKIEQKTSDGGDEQ